MTTKTAPEIRLTLSLDGKVREVDVVADSPEDRDRALAKLRQFLPGLELLEQLAAEPELTISKETRAAGVKT